MTEVGILEMARRLLSAIGDSGRTHGLQVFLINSKMKRERLIHNFKTDNVVALSEN